MPVSDIFAAVRWWVVLAALGWLAFPFLYVLLRRLPDRGFGLARMAGVLVSAYVFWVAGSLGFTGNNAGGILLGVGALAALSILVYRRRPPGERGLRDWLRRRRRLVIVTELVFALVFFLWVWVRAQNPSIAATEKPMEFAFLNAIGRSPTFPPLDPWLSGYAISYYYFGYVMTSLLARLALVAEPVAFNLAIAWLVAGAAVGALSLAYNLIAARPGAGRVAIVLGLVAAAAVPIAGNLQIGLELLHGNGVGSDDFWEWLDVRDVNGPAIATGSPRYLSSNWWWWRTSRVIHEYHLSGRSEEGLEPIVEVPSFSFVLGDLHPHVLALPFAFLSLGVALAWWFGGVDIALGEAWATATWRQRLRRFAGSNGAPLWLFTALVLGGLSFLNTWDVLIHLFVVLAAFFLAVCYRQGNAREALGQTVFNGVLLILVAFVLYLPFYLGFRSQAGPPFLMPMLMRPTRLVHYLIIFGIPLVPIAVMLVSMAVRNRMRHWRLGVGMALALVGLLVLLALFLTWVLAATEPGGGMVAGILNELGKTMPPRPDGAIAPGWGLLAVAALLPDYTLARLISPWLALALLVLLALVIMALVTGARGDTTDVTKREGMRPVSPALPFALLLILTGVLLTLGPEFLYLRDNFGVRLNTTFKFYYQAWVMFGVAAVFAVDWLWSQVTTVPQRALALATTGAYLFMLAVALLFPVYAVQSRAIEYRGPSDAAERQPPTLDGLAYLARFNPSEYDAIMWLREQTDIAGAPPVVLEAVGGQYSGFARVSSATGLPTVLGWPGHEWQWRGGDHPEPGRREPIVRQIYTATDLGVVGFLLDQFDVAYIYVGDQEVNAYGPVGMEKFRDRLEVAYANDRVTIYRWQPAN